LSLFAKTFSNREVQNLLKFYTPSAVVAWTGNTQGLGGVYQNQGNIELLYAASIGHTSTINESVSNLQVKVIDANTINATENVFLKGHSTVVGDLNATVNAQQQWVNSGGTWNIQKENWNYLTFNVQNAGESTVFPQWSLQLSGHSPNLAQMHTVEWNVAPYLGAAIYVVIAAVVATALWMSRRRRNTSDSG